MHRPIVFAITLSAHAATVQAQTLSPNAYQPITQTQRARHFVEKTVGPASLAGGAVSAAWSTLWNRPREYGPTWEGGAKRFGTRTAAAGISNAAEWMLGSVWGEDPRYFRVGQGRLGSRVRHVVTSTFVARRRNGGSMFPLAHYAGSAAGSFASNAWRPPSVSGPGNAAVRVGIDVLSTAASNAFAEFWPDIKKGLFHRRARPGPTKH